MLYWVNQFAVPPDQPGGTRHFDMARELRRRGVDVRLVCSDLNLNTRKYSRRRRWTEIRPVHETIDEVPFVWLTAGSYEANDWRRAVSMLVFMVSSFWYLVRAPSPFGTVYVGSSPHLFGALGTWAAAKVRRRPFILEVRDMWPESYTEMTGDSTGAFVRSMQWIAKLLYRRASRIIVLAEPNAERIVELGAQPWTVCHIPNGVDTMSFLSADLELPRLGDNDHFTFVYAGAHGPANGLDVVVDACSLLQGNGTSNVRVVLVGDGPAKPDLMNLARERGLTNLSFHEPVSKAQVGPLLCTADAALMVLAPVELFSYGVSPNKLYDYLAAGLPVVTNVPGLVTSIVESADAGVACEPGDAEALAKAMSYVADRVRSDPSAFGGGRLYVASNFDRRLLTGRLLDELSRIEPGLYPV